MGMAVMVMPMVMSMRPDGLQLRRRAAPMGGLTTRYFKLDRRMRDVKTITQSAVDAREDVTAFGHRHLGNRHVARQSMGLRAKTPHMQIMDVQNSTN